MTRAWSRHGAVAKRNLRYTPTSSAELDRLAEVSPTDIERAQTRWHQVAPEKVKPLADVTEVVGDASP